MFTLLFSHLLVGQRGLVVPCSLALLMVLVLKIVVRMHLSTVTCPWGEAMYAPSLWHHGRVVPSISLLALGGYERMQNSAQ